MLITTTQRRRQQEGERGLQAEEAPQLSPLALWFETYWSYGNYAEDTSYTFKEGLVECLVLMRSYAFTLGSDVVQIFITGLLIARNVRKHPGLTMIETASYANNVMWPVLLSLGLTGTMVGLESARSASSHPERVGFIYQAGILNARINSVLTAAIFIASIIGIYLSGEGADVAQEVAIFLGLSIIGSAAAYGNLTGLNLMVAVGYVKDTPWFQLLYLAIIFAVAYPLLILQPKLGWLSIGLAYTLAALGFLAAQKLYFRKSGKYGDFELAAHYPQHELFAFLKEKKGVILPLIGLGLVEWLGGLVPLLYMSYLPSAVEAYEPTSQTYGVFSSFVINVVAAYGVVLSGIIGSVQLGEVNCQYNKARQVMLAACFLGASLSILLMAFSIPLARPIVNLMLADASRSTVDLSVLLFRISSTFFIFNVLRKTLQACLWGCGRMVYPLTVAATTRLLVGLGLGIANSEYVGGSAPALLIWLGISEAINCAFLFVRVTEVLSDSIGLFDTTRRLHIESERRINHGEDDNHRSSSIGESAGEANLDEKKEEDGFLQTISRSIVFRFWLPENPQGVETPEERRQGLHVSVLLDQARSSKGKGYYPTEDQRKRFIQENAQAIALAYGRSQFASKNKAGAADSSVRLSSLSLTSDG